MCLDENPKNDNTFETSGEPPNSAKTGIFALKFMKRAEEKQKAEYEKIMQEFEENKEIVLLRFKDVSFVTFQ